MGDGFFDGVVSFSDDGKVTLGAVQLNLFFVVRCVTFWPRGCK